MSGRGGAAQNPLQGDFGEMWLEAVAAGCDILHGRPHTLDLEKADVELTIRGEFNGTYNPTVKVQVKTTDKLRRLDNGDFSYDLDMATYEVLRRDDHSIRRILAVIEVAPSGQRVRLHREGTLLVGHGRWASLEGSAASSNLTSQAVTLPASSTLDPDGLREMIHTFGVRTSTPVPAYDPWGEA
ncbi:DUF4365 domain-containing protein [Actinocrinis puniceicyclus]|uniref:DUF4365 domain-containing protein n=1 Tax=Actinocrinis puniceicyclus TaxID=977794 RepID=A0A8J7WIC5_9ACTN|nr:DUF4365 domain-containing protein [Actinocrinis puniceicyclus]MBS2962726.1 DUF4365 domain-containing protein [Actinocrinis puniceicyclus]